MESGLEQCGVWTGAMWGLDPDPGQVSSVCVHVGLLTLSYETLSTLSWMDEVLISERVTS